jgi:hypothetical protein
MTSHKQISRVIVVSFGGVESKCAQLLVTPCAIRHLLSGGNSPRIHFIQTRKNLDKTYSRNSFLDIFFTHEKEGTWD